MANIMITEVCNLQCPYCFANEMVNEKEYINKHGNHGNITTENFKRAVDFIATNPGERVGIIGGEPTVSPDFDNLMKILIEDNRINTVTVFTNGVELKKHIPVLMHPKVGMLINCNSPSDIGENKFKQMVEGLDILINEYYLKDKIALGINMYKPDFEYEYLLELLVKYDMHHVRTSIAVPNTGDKKTIEPQTYFQQMKYSVFGFFDTLRRNNILPTFDCNLMPKCIMLPEEYNWLQSFSSLEQSANGVRNNLADGCFCSPVIDILPDLTAVRCFGMSREEKVPINRFNNINDLRNYFINSYDSYAFGISSYSLCKGCRERESMKCTGGCLAFKADRINAAREYVQNL